MQDVLLCVLPLVILYQHLRSKSRRAALALGAMGTAGCGAAVVDIFYPSGWFLPRLPPLWLLVLLVWTMVAWIRADSARPPRTSSP
jgi:hypothetical protein